MSPDFGEARSKAADPETFVDGGESEDDDSSDAEDAGEERED